MPVSFYYVINLLGGITLFLFGVSRSTEAFRSSLSTRTREMMSRFTQKKPRAMLFGVVLAAIAQGSTVSTSIAISFVDVGILSLAGSVVVMMGASIGGTFVTFLISLDIVAFSPLLLAVSYMMARMGRGWVEKAGNVFHAVSLILIGMLLLKLGAEPLLNNPGVREGVLAIARRPFTMFGMAVLGTGILQSSASVMALAVTLALSGALPQSAVFPVALGSHLGSTVTMLLAAAGGRYNARILGMATFLYKLVGVVVFLPFIAWSNVFLNRLGFPMATNIVLAQVLVVFLNAAIFYAWPELLIRGSTFLLSFMRSDSLNVPVYLDDKMLEIPSLAVELLAREMIRLANYMEAFLQMLLFPEKGGGELKKLLPEGIRELAEACEQYMYAIRPPSIAEDHEAGREYRTISYAMISFREASRLITGHFREIFENRDVRRMVDEMGASEWSRITTTLMETVRDAFHAFSLGDADLAQRAIGRGVEFDKYIQQLRSRLLFAVGGAGRREESALMDFITVTNRMSHSALEVVRGDAMFYAKKEREEAGGVS